MKQETAVELLKISVEPGCYPLEKAYPADAGFDIRTPTALTIYPHGSAIVNTGVHVQLPHGTDGEIEGKSGLNLRKDILAYGVIDEGYSGEVVCKLYNLGNNTQTFDRGEKIAQLVVKLIPELDGVEIVDEIDGGERGDKGFGSSGR